MWGRYNLTRYIHGPPLFFGGSAMLRIILGIYRPYLHLISKSWVLHTWYGWSVHRFFFSEKHMGVSKNNGIPQIIHFNRVFHYKPSILGYPSFWKHPYVKEAGCPEISFLNLDTFSASMIVQVGEVTAFFNRLVYEPPPFYRSGLSSSKRSFTIFEMLDCWLPGFI